ncbi:MAG TPA: hypothetical protein VHY56_01945 [Candidatus Binataceae bacterium]|nr:hypothetical protein [Candidatus Binataceae bacterium]
MALARELHFLLDSDGALIAFQEKDHSWAGALAFSSDELARRFAAQSHLEAAEIAAIDSADQASVAALITTLKRRPIRYLLLDLDYQSGQCRQVDFEGDSFGAISDRQFTAPEKNAALAHARTT